MKSSMKNKKNVSSILFRFWKILGPGLVTGASDDDPSGTRAEAEADNEHFDGKTTE
jgi:Mn2+/Fe2+ NRAMP family transporter